MSEQRQIAIIGAGNVGMALGKRLSASGMSVAYGLREGKELPEAASTFAVAPQAMSVQEAAAWGDVIFLAVPGNVAVDAALSLGDIKGKVLVDCNNPVRWDAGPVWAPPEEGSLSQAIAAQLPGVSVLKAFNTFGAEFHGDPSLAGGASIDVPMVGDDPDAKQLLAGICEQAGFVPVDAGPLRNASVLENHAILWIHLATVGGQGRDFAFKMHRRSS